MLLPRVMLDNEGARFLDDMAVDEFKARLARLPVRAEFVRNAQETIDAIRSLAAPAKQVPAPARMELRIQAR